MEYTFESFEEYEKYFIKNKVEVTKAIIQGIDRSIDENVDKAIIFDIIFENYFYGYEISIEKDEWLHSIESCMKILQEYNDSNGVIDAYLTKKKYLEVVGESDKK